MSVRFTVGAAGTARAYAIDFETYPAGTNVENIMDIPGVSFYGVAGWHVYDSGGGFNLMTGHVITNLGYGGNLPLTIHFDTPQSNVSFTFGTGYDLCQLVVNGSLNGQLVYSAIHHGSVNGANVGGFVPRTEGVVTITNSAVDYVSLHDNGCGGISVAVDDITSSADGVVVPWHPHDHRLNPHPAAPAAAYCDEDRAPSTAWTKTSAAIWSSPSAWTRSRRLGGKGRSRWGLAIRSSCGRKAATRCIGCPPGR